MFGELFLMSYFPSPYTVRDVKVSQSPHNTDSEGIQGESFSIYHTQWMSRWAIPSVPPPGVDESLLSYHIQWEVKMSHSQRTAHSEGVKVSYSSHTTHSEWVTTHSEWVQSESFPTYHTQWGQGESFPTYHTQWGGSKWVILHIAHTVGAKMSHSHSQRTTPSEGTQIESFPKYHTAIRLFVAWRGLPNVP